MGKEKRLGRVGQFLRAIRARISSEDLAFMEAHLPEEARPLFLAMHLADQRHVLNVAYTAWEQAEREGAEVDRELLLRCCLLHDVGRVKGTMDIWGKVWAVLAEKFLPAGLWQKLECTEAAHFWQKPGLALYVYRCHPEIGAARLREVGLNREAEIIRFHHSPPMETEAEELKLLRRADALN